MSLVLGFDYGTQKIGVAVGQSVTGGARELAVLKASDGVPNWDEIGKLLSEWQPDALIVGLPLNMDGSASDISQRAEKFARRLHGRFGLPVHLHDERLSSFAARGERLSQDSGRKSRNKPIDALAAALIVEGFLQNQPKDNALESAATG